MYRLVYLDGNGIRRVFGRKIVVHDWRQNARKVLAQAAEVQALLGGDVIDYVRYIKTHHLQNDSVDEITARLVEETDI